MYGVLWKEGGRDTHLEVDVQRIKRKVIWEEAEAATGTEDTLVDTFTRH